MRAWVGFVLVGWLMTVGFAEANTVPEPPLLAQQVASGDLPPMAKRLPEVPKVVKLELRGGTNGAYGGTLHTLVGRPQDVRYMVVWGYARLLGFDASRELQPDIVERIEIKDDREFTFHLRKGHRWSDGAPFTTADFEYYWEDVLNDSELSPQGLPKFLLVQGLPPRFEVLDETTFRYSWDAPNHQFLPAIAGARPEFLYQPAHYLKSYHRRYGADEDNWTATYREKSRQYRNTNPELPSLQPWIRAGSPNDGLFVFVRNPYFHRVDSAGHQLPYIDRVELKTVDPEEIPSRVADGQSDLQALGVGFEHFALLKLAEVQKDIVVDLWVTAKGSELALYPNLTAADPVWREVLLTADFRRALSMGVDRAAINQLVFHGLGVEAANSVLRESPLFEPDFEDAWTNFDVEAANALLDGLGLTPNPDDGVRRLSDGRPMRLSIATVAEDPTLLEVLNMVAETWSQLGIETEIETMPRRELRERALAGEVVMSAWKGLENGVAGPDWLPRELVPSEAVQLGWPLWGQYVESGGYGGRPVDNPDVARLIFLRKAWETAQDRAERRAAWQSLLAWHAENVFSIGTVHAIPQPVVRRRSLRNVPDDAIYNWEPGAYFGVYDPSTFWFDDADRRK